MNNYVNQLNQLLKEKGFIDDYINEHISELKNLNKVDEVVELNQLIKNLRKGKFFYVDYDTNGTTYSFSLIMDMTIYHQTETFEEMKNYIITKQKFN